MLVALAAEPSTRADRGLADKTSQCGEPAQRDGDAAAAALQLRHTLARRIGNIGVLRTGGAENLDVAEEVRCCCDAASDEH